jgi:hypothetical protein
MLFERGQRLPTQSALATMLQDYSQNVKLEYLATEAGTRALQLLDAVPVLVIDGSYAGSDY